MVVTIEIRDNKNKVRKSRTLSSGYITHFVAFRGEDPLNMVFQEMINSDEELKKEFTITQEQFQKCLSIVKENLKEAGISSLQTEE